MEPTTDEAVSIAGVEMTRQVRALSLVRGYIITRLDVTDPRPKFDAYVVWFCYILGGWKALVSTTLPDGMYYEVTYNATKKETYIDAYKKFENVCLPDPVEVVEDDAPSRGYAV